MSRQDRRPLLATLDSSGSPIITILEELSGGRRCVGRGVLILRRVINTTYLGRICEHGLYGPSWPSQLRNKAIHRAIDLEVQQPSWPSTIEP